MTTVFRHGALRLYLLKLLSEQPRHGYEVISLLEDRFLGLYAPSAGTVYPRLAKLEAEGLVRHEEADGRKTYSLTDAGREELARHQDALHTLEADLSKSVAQMAQDVRSQVQASVRDLRAELKQAAREVRRESRARVRTETSRPADPLTASLANEFDRLRDEMLDIVRETGASTAEVVRDVLKRVREDVHAAISDDSLS